MKCCSINCLILLLLVACSSQKRLIVKDIIPVNYSNNNYKKIDNNNKEGTTPKFVVHQEEPIPLKKIPPTIPKKDFGSGIEGSVIVRAEVF